MIVRASLRASLLAAVALATLSAAGMADDANFAAARRDADGRFLNTAGELNQADLTVTLPFFARRIGAMLSGRTGYPETVANDGSFLRDNAQHSVPTVTWIGHATLLVQMDHATFLTDPIWSERASPVSFTGPKRAQAPGVAIDDLPEIDFVLVSHDHYDHLDVPSLQALAKRSPETVFVVPLENGATLRDAAASLRDWPRMQQALARAQPLVQGDARATRALAFIAAGASQLLLGPASYLFPLQMKVRSSTRATSEGSLRARKQPGRFSGFRRRKVPAFTISSQRASHSSLLPSHQCTRSGAQSAAVSATHFSSSRFLIYSGALERMLFIMPPEACF